MVFLKNIYGFSDKNSIILEVIDTWKAYVCVYILLVYDQLGTLFVLEGLF